MRQKLPTQNLPSTYMRFLKNCGLCREACLSKERRSTVWKLFMAQVVVVRSKECVELGSVSSEHEYFHRDRQQQHNYQHGPH